MTVPFSPASVVCDVVFSDSDCEHVKPQTFSLSRKREAIVVLESLTNMDFEIASEDATCNHEGGHATAERSAAYTRV